MGWAGVGRVGNTVGWHAMGGFGDVGGCGRCEYALKVLPGRWGG